MRSALADRAAEDEPAWSGVTVRRSVSGGGKPDTTITRELPPQIARPYHPAR